ncbi:nucleotide sugar dehydrogenase [Lecanosticta acicola]|uniref:Nucleotide sugar dehydrogenase n=1 Tax=Lecanosticta acicola TaxID=111012 RepID=A0AAI8YW87_9PEZI|nr:nucleotide sugar dehydrogenase [Lecanosticta acicola]
MASAIFECVSPAHATIGLECAPQQALRLPDTPPLTPPCDSLSRSSSCDYLGDLGLSSTSGPVNYAQPTVAVIGTGYVGLHLVEAFSSAYEVIAFDISNQRIQEIRPTLPSNVTCTSNVDDLSRATHFLMSVSTVIDAQQRIDSSCIQKAIQTIETHARPGSTVVIESSVAVGMTRDLLRPLMTSKSLKCGMSPERVDPGRTYPHYTTIPKIVSGLDNDSLQSIHALYSKVFLNLVPVTSTEVAEMTKLYENCQRMMCIAYANEMADACRQLSQSLSEKQASETKTLLPDTITIDPLEVSRAAATKPFGYMPYTPSLGVGGHCIPCNPFYLLSNSSFPLLEACTERMRERPARMGDQLMRKIRKATSRRLHVLVVGLGFKRGQAVLSHSPGLALATHLLSNYNVYVEYADPLVDQNAVPSIPKMEGSEWTVENLRKFDGIVVAVDQPGLDLNQLRQAQAQGVHVDWYCNVQ